MKPFSIAAALYLASFAAAAPVAFEERAAVELEDRQLFGSGRRDDLINNVPCRRITYIFARGTTETPNLGALGRPLGDALADEYGDSNVAQQGVNYDAGLATNFIGGDPAGIREATRLFELVHTRCPNSIIVAGGYSQGAAIMHQSIAELSSAVRNQIAGVVTFGDTYNLQDGRTIPSLPREKVRIFCRADDGVCYGTLTVTAGHLAYGSDVDEAAEFLQERIEAVS